MRLGTFLLSGNDGVALRSFHSRLLLNNLFGSFEMNITVVELEETFYKVAQKYFDLTLDHHQRVVIADGLQFLRDHQRSGPTLHILFHEHQNFEIKLLYWSKLAI